MPNIADLRSLAGDNLGPAANNIQSALASTPTPGYMGAGTRKANLVAASAAINTTETVLAQIALLPGTSLSIGSVIRARLTGACTSTNADVSTFTARAGTAGTTADQSLATATVTAATGTGIAFMVDFEFVVRTLGATGTGMFSMGLRNVGVTGISNAAVANVNSAATNLATTTATFFSITYVSAATTTTSTFQIADIELLP